MIKRFAYIVLLLVVTPCLLLAEKHSRHLNFKQYNLRLPVPAFILTDTTTSKNAKRQQEQDEKKKIKEIARAKRQPKPEKIDVPGTANQKAKPKRQRRPEGMERPPEIPRRNGG